jgi:hypothetical protein
VLPEQGEVLQPNRSAAPAASSSDGHRKALPFTVILKSFHDGNLLVFSFKRIGLHAP